jgi:hypothetical protein
MSGGMQRVDKQPAYKQFFGEFLARYNRRYPNQAI